MAHAVSREIVAGVARIDAIALADLVEILQDFVTMDLENGPNQ